jgi:hypothetical protein
MTTAATNNNTNTTINMHGRGRRKMVAAKEDLTYDHVNRSTQQSTKDGGEQMGRQ